MKFGSRIRLALCVLFFPQSWLREVASKVLSDPEVEAAIRAYAERHSTPIPKEVKASG